MGLFFRFLAETKTKVNISSAEVKMSLYKNHACSTIKLLISTLSLYQLWSSLSSLLSYQSEKA